MDSYILHAALCYRYVIIIAFVIIMQNIETKKKHNDKIEIKTYCCTNNDG